MSPLPRLPRSRVRRFPRVSGDELGVEGGGLFVVTFSPRERG